MFSRPLPLDGSGACLTLRQSQRHIITHIERHHLRSVQTRARQPELSSTTRQRSTSVGLELDPGRPRPTKGRQIFGREQRHTAPCQERQADRVWAPVFTQRDAPGARRLPREKHCSWLQRSPMAAVPGTRSSVDLAHARIHGHADMARLTLSQQAEGHRLCPRVLGHDPQAGHRHGFDPQTQGQALGRRAGSTQAGERSRPQTVGQPIKVAPTQPGALQQVRRPGQQRRAGLRPSLLLVARDIAAHAKGQAQAIG